MTKAKNLADKIDLHLQVNSPGFHLSDDDMRLIAASLRGADTPDTIALDELLKFASQYDGCTHDSLIQMIHREFEIRRRTNNEEMENYRMALAYISRQSTDQQSRELAETALNAFPADRVPQSSQVVSIDLMQRIWANLYFNEEDAGNTFQATLNEVVDWLAERGSLPPDTRPDRKSEA